MKISSATNGAVRRPFYKDDKITIEFEHLKGKITCIHIFYKKQWKQFPVKNFDIKKAWIEVEKHTSDIE